jgi:hypothetical protein
MLNTRRTSIHLKAYIFLFSLLSSSAPYAIESEMTCTNKSGALSNYLELKETEGELVSFSYTAVTLINKGGPNPSCSIDASKLENKRGQKDSVWSKTASGYVIKLANSANEDDQVSIKKTKSGYTFDFKNVSPMNCGHSSGIAEKISIAHDNKKCIVHKLRN